MKSRNTLIGLLVLVAVAAGVLVYALSAITGIVMQPLPASGESSILPLNPADVVEDGDTGIRYVKDQLIVSFSKDADISSVKATLAQFGGEIVGFIGDMNIFQVRIDHEVTMSDLLQIIDRMNNTPPIEAASLNTVSSLSSSTDPYDPWAENYPQGDQVYDEQHPDGSNWGLEAIKAPDAWKYNDQMATVKIGILDGGFYINSPDLKIDPSLATGMNGKYLSVYGDYIDSNTKDIERANQHGTFNAGTIGANQDNGVGIAGMVKNRELYVCRTDGDVMHIQYFFDYCIRKKHVKIINLSMADDITGVRHAKIMLGLINLDSDQKTITSRNEWASFLSKLKSNPDTSDFLLVESAGNASVDAQWAGYLCCLNDKTLEKWHLQDDCFLIVGSNGKPDNKENYKMSSFSNNGVDVDVVAPGEDIYGILDMSKYGNMSGTSMSAPFVTGLAGLISGINPNLTCAQIRQIIIDTSDIPVQGTDGKPYKMIDAGAAVEEAVQTIPTTGSTPPQQANGITSLSIDGSMNSSWVARTDNGYAILYNGNAYVTDNSFSNPRLISDIPVKSLICAHNWVIMRGSGGLQICTSDGENKSILTEDNGFGGTSCDMVLYGSKLFFVQNNTNIMCLDLPTIQVSADAIIKSQDSIDRLEVDGQTLYYSCNQEGKGYTVHTIQLNEHGDYISAADSKAYGPYAAYSVCPLGILHMEESTSTGDLQDTYEDLYLNNKKLNYGIEANPVYYNGKIYGNEVTQTTWLCSMNPDGSDFKEFQPDDEGFSNFDIGSIAVVSDKIFFMASQFSGDNDFEPYCCDLDGKNYIKINLSAVNTASQTGALSSADQENIKKLIQYARIAGPFNDPGQISGDRLLSCAYFFYGDSIAWNDNRSLAAQYGYEGMNSNQNEAFAPDGIHNLLTQFFGNNINFSRCTESANAPDAHDRGPFFVEDGKFCCSFGDTENPYRYENIASTASLGDGRYTVVTDVHEVTYDWDKDTSTDVIVGQATYTVLRSPGSLYGFIVNAAKSSVAQQ